MGRVRKNYILFKYEGKESTLAGSFSSMKRAREAIKEDAWREVQCDEESKDYVPNIELMPDGGRLKQNENKTVYYKIASLEEDKLTNPGIDF